MTEQQTSGSRRDLYRILPGILISLAALAVIGVIVDWGDLFTALKGAEYKYLLLGLPIYIVSYGFRAQAWRILLMEGASFRQVFLTMQAGYFLNNVLPFRLGELGRAFLLGRTGLGFWRVFSTILIERAFDMILAAGLLLGTMSFVWGSSQSQPLAFAIAAMVCLGLLVLHLLARYQDVVLRKFEAWSLRWPLLSRFGPERLGAFFNGLSALVQLPRFMRVLFWMALSWASAVYYHYILMQAFDPGAKILWAGFGMATASLGVALPSSPSYIGILEAAWIGALALFGVPFSTALGFAIVAHMLHILISCVFGGYALAKEGQTIGQLYAQIRKKRFE